MNKEPSIIINDHTLTHGQVMTVRVALAGFYFDLSDPDALGDDEHGRAMTAAYRQRLSEIFKWL